VLLDGPFLAGVSQFHRLNILAARRIFGGRYRQPAGMCLFIATPDFNSIFISYFSGRFPVSSFLGEVRMPAIGGM